MPQPISSALATAFAGPVTQPGYLIQINGSQILRWSTLGALTYNGVPWVDQDLDVQGLKWDPTQDPSAKLRIQNMDNAIGAFFMLEQLVDVTVDIYQIARGALTAGDAVYLARLVIDECTIGLDSIDVSLVGSASMNALSPRRRVDAVNGFSFALPVGTQIAWGSEIFILEEG